MKKISIGIMCLFLLIYNLCLFVACNHQKNDYNTFEGGEEIGYWYLKDVNPEAYMGEHVYYIPETDKNGNPITGIGSAAIHDIGKIEEIVIGDHIEWISYYAIQSMPNLKKVTIGKNVSSIKEGLFQNCPSLETVVIHSENPYFCMEDKFILSKDKSTLLRGWSSSDNIPTTVKVIAEAAFARNEFIEDLKIPNTVQEIKGSAFFQCSNLKKLYIPNSVKSIPRLAFLGCMDLTVYVEGTELKLPFEEEWNITMPASETREQASFATVVVIP